MGQQAQLVMRRPHLDGLPELAPLPDGYGLRPYDGSRDESSLIATLAESFREPWDAARLARELTASPDVHTVYVATYAGRVVGTAASRYVPARFPDAGYVHWVGVASDHLRRGLAAALLGRVLGEFRQRGYPLAVLETDDFRIPAIRAYLKYGFLPEYDARGEDHRPRWSRVMTEVVAPPR